MNINTTTPHNQNFQARIKMNKPNLKVLAQAALGTSALAAGAATVAEGGLSVYALNDNPQGIGSIPNEVVKSHHEFLYSTGEPQYDAAGEKPQFPVQSTIAPSAMLAGGSYMSLPSYNAFKNAFGEDKLEATTVMPIDASKAVSANKSAQKVMLGTSYLGTAAASLYSGATNSDFVNNMLPESVKLDPFCRDKEISGQMSLLSGGLSASAPVALGSGKLASMASDTKSSQFVADTFTDGKTDKKLPS